MIPSGFKLARPVKHPTPDADTVILTGDRSLHGPALLGLGGIGMLLCSFS
jgi:hypothetical protein